ncbi:hypothetical protein FZI13_13175 [Cronobacter sakazakii]|nr:hypothetical protein FZI13_13175 [Cronobacter sakazakii]
MKRSQTKTALHRTRLQVLDRKNFSVLFFYKRYRQPAPPLGFCVKTQNEKIEKNFTFFQFQGSEKDLAKIVSAGNIKRK